MHYNNFILIVFQKGGPLQHNKIYGCEESYAAYHNKRAKSCQKSTARSVCRKDHRLRRNDDDLLIFGPNSIYEEVQAFHECGGRRRKPNGTSGRCVLADCIVDGVWDSSGLGF